jgi:hypothetical protein
VGVGDDVIWLLNPDAVREGIWRMARLPGDCIEGDLIEGEDREGEDRAGGGGVSLTGDSCGERRELMSMAKRCGAKRGDWRGPGWFLPSPRSGFNFSFSSRTTQPTRVHETAFGCADSECLIQLRVHSYQSSPGSGPKVKRTGRAPATATAAWDEA